MTIRSWRTLAPPNIRSGSEASSGLAMEVISVGLDELSMSLRIGASAPND